MKIVAFILAIMVFVLSCMPCMDGTYNFGNAKAKTIISAGHNHQQRTDTDACSPFCTCNCCAGFTFTVTIYQIDSVIKLAPEKNVIQLPSSISEISLPVWQPPQLS